MREKHNYMVITFHTTAEAMAMEKYCKNNGIPGRLIPVPREISAGCGLSWRMKTEEYVLFQGQLSKANLEYEQVAELML